MSGLVSALSIYADTLGRAMPRFPDDTMVGALMNYIHTPTKNFQPMNANMGIVPSTVRRGGPRKTRYLAAARHAEQSMVRYRASIDWLFAPATTPE